MQKHRLVFLIVVLVGVFLVAISHPMRGQSSRELAVLYENQQFSKLKEYYEKSQISDSGWKEFIGALFEDNADSAIMMYASVYKSNQDKVLRKFVVERIADYYYARGYYKTSERLQKDKRFLEELVSSQREPEPTNTVGYGVQVGAFGNYENALTLKNEMLKKNRNVSIVNKKSDGENLYLVVIGKYSDREGAERKLQSLRANNVNGFVIQY